jgi:SAM-dependent methyltransferase
MKHWKDAGEEWSKPWGSSEAQWSGTILPRIRDYLPTGTILEIAPGFGRWTNYLKDYCDNLLLVEKSRQCFEACRARFGTDPKIKIYHNDGQSLSMIPDESVDFVFTFDSLVHVRREFIEAYLSQLGTKLKKGGKGFFHHSNLGAYANSAANRWPKSIVKILQKTKLLDWEHHRTPSMTADLFRALCEQSGLHCVRQELINWRGRRLIDCFSHFVRSGSDQTNAPQIIMNPHFMREVARIRRAIPSAKR